MDVKSFLDHLDVDFYTGIPDSQLKPLCNYLYATYGISHKHIIGANEGNCTAMAAGYYLATGKIPLVYMQNSGIGNVVNPVCSLLNDKVYAVPCIFVVGWRGEPGIKDEPQHVFQGEVTLKLLQDLDIKTFVIDKSTTTDEIKSIMYVFREELDLGKSVAFVVRKGGLTYKETVVYKNEYPMIREDVIRQIVKIAGRDILVSTTGKASRELFEIREQNQEEHNHDFLTVGSMGHTSSIALGIAMEKKNQRVWCIDGDGSTLMHLGAMAVIGSRKPGNLVHIVINNGAHETVGGQPTVMDQVNLVEIAKACGYEKAICVYDFSQLDLQLQEAKNEEKLTLIEIKCGIGARENLGRPTVTAKENKEKFMKYLKSVK
ncbi:MAG: phosphonopyruvate decarboxylase [Acetivibrio sp.]